MTVRNKGKTEEQQKAESATDADRQKRRLKDGCSGERSHEGKRRDIIVQELHYSPPDSAHSFRPIPISRQTNMNCVNFLFYYNEFTYYAKNIIVLESWYYFSSSKLVKQKKKFKEMHTKGEEKGSEEMAGQNEVDNGGTTEENSQQQNRQPSGDTASLLQRTMGALYEMNPELETNQEEIRKLDSQLDHLNDYMDKVEERLKAHNDKLMETLRQQREDREKRRRSFHERLEQSRQEDDDFQQQLSSVLSRMDSVRGKKINMKTDGD